MCACMCGSSDGFEVRIMLILIFRILTCEYWLNYDFVLEII